eukprot:CAMPEP_0116559066 /NCGR_PEP_ID=MMETSP0397-20121206/10176_1 /TAXON_ID=216820 /ORGANISM="Cyclophora tenuis, Strain ECT3854" /LENGTH=67 /DNA_ID=CAMNT_0004084767 /DNA_START=59 /DNA_END=259 /DNA_ORIENTATION=+
MQEEDLTCNQRRQRQHRFLRSLPKTIKGRFVRRRFQKRYSFGTKSEKEQSSSKQYLDDESGQDMMLA